MKKTLWKKHHKWFGLFFCFFMLMFCISGIILNHREFFAEVNLNRSCLPETYHFQKWNNGLLRGVVELRPSSSSHRDILLYGIGGIWQSDTSYSSFKDFNAGLPVGADYRHIRGVVETADRTLFAAGQFGVYRKTSGPWECVLTPSEDEVRFSDITMRGDSIIVLSRSRLYLSLPPYRDFTPIDLKAPAGFDGKVSLFKTVWQLHSGELMGIFGKLFMDSVAIIFIVLCITGILIWLLPECLKKSCKTGSLFRLSQKLFKTSFNWHNLLGRYLFFFLLCVVVTGWCLRPPVLIALVHGKVPAVPGSSLDSPNPWNDKLRMIRYDEAAKDWLVSTSEGFYSLQDFSSVPVSLAKQPPVSVMGLNVFQKNPDGEWLCGSFSGMYVWDRAGNRAYDYFTGEDAPEKQGPPFGKKAISGYCKNFEGPDAVVENYNGSAYPDMPDSFTSLPISLWNLALEVHTGRIYTFLGPVSLIYIFFAGLIVLWCLWTGWKIRVRAKKKR